jgi:sec-independent protein translocase protein TatB
MSFGETIFLFFLALIIFGPKKLPEIARQVGKYLNEFKRASNEFKAQIEQEIAHLDNEKPQILPPTLAQSSFAGDRHVTEGLAPEGTASRTLDSATINSASESSAPETASTNTEPAVEATLAAPLIAAPLIEDSPTHENPEAATVAEKTAVEQAADAAINEVKTSAAQESHA